jgi:hypothetical protein
MIGDSTVTYNERDQVFECSACEDCFPISRSSLRDPEEFVRILELAQLDHKDCHTYKEPRMARNARRFRKEVNRRLLVKANHLIGNA